MHYKTFLEIIRKADTLSKEQKKLGKAEAKVFVIKSSTGQERNVGVYGNAKLRLRRVRRAREIQAHWQEVITGRAKTV